MVCGGRPVRGRRSSHVASWHVNRNSQCFEEYNRKGHLTVDIIQIMILLKLNRERDELPLRLRPGPSRPMP
ncbi:hypothetical protein TNCV_4983571 [Trichonephila clavipes]|nr:hypothetical protein TNCV_4983571 [Trichonephila clavipes]